ncbi:multi-copper oxidase laccase-like protein [Papiliotrema laurentii]|uniref:Multi-copper oxidase laccase-like protein n=1 Tax=Papiliotrema laurentii TaxID=5418 RepID=A0AAD9CZF3_PAPLA|nr:multi-copper oxidase laccase-like protein [Papiliotrema laurentii]
MRSDSASPFSALSFLLVLLVYGCAVAFGQQWRRQTPSSTTFNYPQPPLPTVSAVRDSSSWTLSPDFEITNVPTTREFTFDISAVAAAPDGYPRQIYSVNGMFPGPLIEANEGDEIVVHVTNHLDIGMTIHWHGMFQNGTQFMDGVPGISQCPIAPGKTFTYRFRVQNQYGSYWWHSHFGNTLADGLVGGLIVHSVRDPLVRGRDFDEETIVMVQDWMDVQSETIVAGLHSDKGYRGTLAPPQGDAILLNGLGRTNCSNLDIQDLSLPCTAPALPEIRVTAGKRVRLRILNVGSFGMFRISIDEHAFEVVEVDDTAVWGPSGIHEIQVSTAQRTSIVIDTDRGQPAMLVTSILDDEEEGSTGGLIAACVGSAGLPQTALAVLRYVDENGECTTTSLPDSQPWDDLQGPAAKCQDIDQEYELTPREVQNAPTEIFQTHSMSSSLGRFVGKDGHKIGTFGFNNITYQAQIGNPLLHQLQQGKTIDDAYIAHAEFDRLGGGDLIVNNLDLGISHPFHFHGKPFHIAARGEGNITVEEWEAIRDTRAKTDNPLRRDVIQIPGGHWAVLRMYTNLPGVWPLHCHIGWHLSEGKLAAIVFQPEAIRSIDQPEEWLELCRDYDHDELGPAKRAVSPFEADLSEARARGDQGKSRRGWLMRRGPRDD